MKKPVVKNYNPNLVKVGITGLIAIYLAVGGFAGYKFGKAVKNNRENLQGNIEHAVNINDAIIPFTVGASVFGSLASLAVGADIVKDKRKKPDNSLSDFADYVKNNQEYDGLGRS